MAKLLISQVKSISAPGKYGDGDGLWLKVGPTGRKMWVFRYQINGVRRDMSLGSADAVSLRDARLAKNEAKKLLADGIDPLRVRARQVSTSDAPLDEATPTAPKTFNDAAKEYLDAHMGAWKNATHKQQWVNTLASYVRKRIGKVALDQVTTDDVLAILTPIWLSKPETARRVRGRIERILDYACARGWRSGENPARMRGHLDHLLPRRPATSKAHFAAMPWKDLPDFFMSLHSEDTSMSALALQFCILTGCRTNEVLQATWSEIDMKARVWSIPPARMKMGRLHRVPLARQTVSLLETLKDYRRSQYLFPGQRQNKPLSNMSMLMMMRRLGYGHLTVHGFRSSFRDWAAEATQHPSAVAEMALAHTIKNKVEAAYRRGDMIEKRTALMQDWADYLTGCTTPTEQVEDLVKRLSRRDLERLIALAQSV
ncbi:MULTISPECIES: tyrosine-type recombinase/integrase [Haematospirillum]|uniref:tyrosine-type recombinase/integrase n=1 Tax=Haematospirillum TaxID=1804663 RepID=UPI00143294D2|nr:MULTISPECIES: site-specific integrase [Haematospirillum]NKD54675.1 tyrosine-type recombinase/integrase [Haematospirillum sp. H4890]NKD74713.1 tyrosine-type recombinase/integrase [Haematospirillum sp. H4485]NKD92358.1 tyrosine-type recombinase/integrase [Haematospirillum jordaniae]